MPASQAIRDYLITNQAIKDYILEECKKHTKANNIELLIYIDDGMISIRIKSQLSVWRFFRYDVVKLLSDKQTFKHFLDTVQIHFHFSDSI